MRKLFRAFERASLEYLLISGQATVLYGAAMLYLAEIPRPGAAVLRWASKNSFRAEERAVILEELGRPRTVAVCARQIAKEVQGLQARDRAYWSPILRDLRKMRAEGKLLPDGAPVSEFSANT